MTRTARRTAWIVLTLLLTASGAAAQEAAPTEDSAVAVPAAEAAPAEADAAPAAAEAAAAEDPWTSSETRNAFLTVLHQHPPELGTILALDPTLLGNDAFLAGYPELAAFVADHPAVRRNPRYYLSGFELQPAPGDALDDFFEMAAIFGTFLIVALALAWLVRTFVEQKRWNRLSRTQSEVHNKILDRFGSSEELLEYIRSPAGTRFLESAPIPVRTERRVAPGSPVGRAVWSTQLGVVIAAAAVGMLLVGAWYAGDTARALFAMGAIALCVGLGFVGSAAVSIVLSRRLGLWDSATGSAAAADDTFAG